MSKAIYRPLVTNTDKSNVKKILTRKQIILKVVN